MRSAVDPQASTVSIYGSDIKYWIYHPEQSRTILMLHGFRGNHIGLKYIIAGLNGYCIIVPDLPGFGESTPMTDRSHDITGYGDFAREFTTRLRLKQPVLLGHSFGSIIAAHLAARSPELFERLILLNPIAVKPGGGIKAAPTQFVKAYYWLGTYSSSNWSRRILVSRTFSHLMSLSLSRTKDKNIRNIVYNHHLSDLEQPQNREVIAKSFAESISKTALDDAARITLDTLLIAGDKDPIATLAAQRHLKDTIPTAQLIIIPKVGHLIHLETPRPAAEAIAQYLG